MTHRGLVLLCGEQTRLLEPHQAGHHGQRLGLQQQRRIHNTVAQLHTRQQHTHRTHRTGMAAARASMEAQRACVYMSMGPVSPSVCSIRAHENS